MSLILEALKKLDREKSARREGTANIAVDVLRSDSPRPGKRIPISLLIVLTAFVAVILTYTVITQFGLLSKPSPPAVAKNTSQKSEQAAPVSSESAAPGKTQGLTAPPSAADPSALGQPAPPPLAREPVRTLREGTKRIPSKTQTQIESKKNAASLVEKKTEQNKITEQKPVIPEEIRRPVEPPPQAFAPTSPQVSSTTPPPLTLTGIVWYEEPSQRIAVVNGTVATEGSSIQGVKIVEILADRVRFSYNNQPFEIRLGH